jgi:hypothetical protein
MFLQLWHLGRASHSAFHGGSFPVSASAITVKGDDIATPVGERRDGGDSRATWLAGRWRWIASSPGFRRRLLGERGG